MVEHGLLGLTSRGDQVAACAIVTVCLAGLFVILRFLTRTRVLHILGREDWCILVSLVSMLITCRKVESSEVRTNSDKVANAIQAAYATVIVYNVSLTLAKISVLFLYLRIFTTRNATRVCHVQMAIVIMCGLAATLSLVFFCTPIASFWDVTVKGKCFSKGPLWYATAGINIATDVMIVSIPATLIHRLQLSARQKIGLYMIFMVGIFICIVSILRLHSLYFAAISTDPTYVNVGVSNWSCIELNAAILCACLPTLKPLFARIFPSLMRSGQGRATYHQSGSGNNAYRSGNKSFVASSSDRPTKRKIVQDSASETAIVNSLDDFPLADIDVEDTYSRKRDDTEDVEVCTSTAQSNA
ncbi:hypothetical protein CC80DRAFT_479116 [Byssothecium circinans]|uniref:Rhodopsin domain-containing protein n=1 Tax=Byssothecium circinans TaxID=147558 RepID=A0A6A5TJC5_9PLEO|nr:hypothetical protein CC80DRAFT_479116 [Byssothecium circinans]